MPTFTQLLETAVHFDGSLTVGGNPDIRVSLASALASVVTGSGEKRRLRKSWPKPLSGMMFQDGFNKQLWQMIRFDVGLTNSIGGLMCTSIMGPPLTEDEHRILKSFASMCGSVHLCLGWGK